MLMQGMKYEIINKSHQLSINEICCIFCTSESISCWREFKPTEIKFWKPTHESFYYWYLKEMNTWMNKKYMN